MTDAMARHDDLPPRRGPGYGAVITVALLTSVLASAGTAYVMDRWGLDLIGAAGQQEVPATVQVPRVLGMRPEAADEILTGRGLRLVVRDQEPSLETAEGEIAEQVPLAGSRVDRGERVEVIVSTGMPLVDIPQVVGLEVDEARRLIAQAGLPLGRISETGEGEPGTVTETNPPQGTQTTPETPVALTVVPGGIEVPDLVGKNSRQARSAIESAGLEVGRVRRRYDETRGPYVVLSQDPEAGTLAPPDSEVELTINDGY